MTNDLSFTQKALELAKVGCETYMYSQSSMYLAAGLCLFLGAMIGIVIGNRIK
jgi:hypothetical protein